MEYIVISHSKLDSGSYVDTFSGIVTDISQTALVSEGYLPADKALKVKTFGNETEIKCAATGAPLLTIMPNCESLKVKPVRACDQSNRLASAGIWIGLVATFGVFIGAGFWSVLS